MQDPGTFNELIEQIEHNDLYSKLIEQLNKDLLMANIDLEFDVEVVPTSLEYILKDTVYDLIQNKFDAYLNLLYITDVAEAKVKQIESVDTLEIASKVTFLILQREWQKVWFRTNSSKNKHE